MKHLGGADLSADCSTFMQQPEFMFHKAGGDEVHLSQHVKHILSLFLFIFPSESPLLLTVIFHFLRDTFKNIFLRPTKSILQSISPCELQHWLLPFLTPSPLRLSRRVAIAVLNWILMKHRTKIFKVQTLSQGCRHASATLSWLNVCVISLSLT